MSAKTKKTYEDDAQYEVQMARVERAGRITLRPAANLTLSGRLLNKLPAAAVKSAAKVAG